MNILIIGSEGFVGRHLCSKLKKNHRIYRIDHKHDIDDKDYFYSDLTKKSNTEKISDLIEGNKIDVIINLASILVSEENSKDISVLYDNLYIIESVISTVKQLKPHQLINFSSIAVYPNISGKYSENSIVDPSNNFECLYGLSKFNSEVLFNYYCNDTDTDVINLRVSQIIGEGMREDRILNVFKNELQNQNTVTVFGNGERTSCFVEIDYLKELISNLIDKRISGGTYNICQKHMSYKELAEYAIMKYGNNQSKIIFTEVGNKSKIKIDNSKLYNKIKNNQ